MTPEESNQLDIISAYIGSPLTEEQKEFAADFTKDTMSFSDPGTGKTHTLIAGLLLAQKHHKIPGADINCMSFTNAAVSEMAGRYNALCKKCTVTPSVKFNTFHSLSRQMLKSAFPNMQVIGYENFKTAVKDMQMYLLEEGIDVGDDVKFIRKLINTINNLNSSLTFHPENVVRKHQFVELDMDLDIFQNLRVRWFMRGLIRDTIVQGDIPLYCLYALMNNRDNVSDKWKSRYKIMVVDEFQDLTLLHLRILSYIASTLIVIGDMKQQIYAFNGACPQIVDAYFKLHPNARICNLTKSFRCSQKIADFATRLIKPNDRSIQTFTGHAGGGDVQIIHRRDLNWEEIVNNIAVDHKLHNIDGARDVMFLYRNNASAIPIIEELYKNNIAFRCSKYAKIMDIPIFNTLSALVNAAWQPGNYEIVTIALRLFPEFKDIQMEVEPPPVQAMRASGKDLFSLNYKYKESSSTEILIAMMQARKDIEAKKTAGVTYMKLMPVYEKYLYKLEWWKVDNSKEFYFNLVGQICNSKTYVAMYNEEIEKEQKNEHAIAAGMGIRCYTMHSAKGLEADDVYILDCDEGKFPNRKIMDTKIDDGCLYDVAVDIRSERNLLYVAVTRAKDNVIITYSGEPCKLVVNPDDSEYTKYDSEYDSKLSEYDDAEEFFNLFKLGSATNG